MVVPSAKVDRTSRPQQVVLTLGFAVSNRLTSVAVGQHTDL